MTPEDLSEKGRVLHGARWQTALARDLSVTDRTMRRWLAGQSPIPDMVEAKVQGLLARRMSELRGMSEERPEVVFEHRPHDPAERLKLIEAIRASARTKILPGPDAAHAADFLYDENGLPK
ncbi:helix-turn-helix domain-containing protein [Phenylobacterium aquaticum]|uniref:helix-turn-helix domain-containing protein n=1 Tax=Phenylobacterium aquaticum TaxID=1763816 RepID=UPI001F5C0BDB|nr:helix-turn-helix domain-containing protein [Phenylobacterium aquaticum]MCI3131886.1 helix-turn-helix domain-containing protein [Phenylobacterium aquaticum]